MPRKSKLLSEKLDGLFIEEPDLIAEEFGILVDTSLSLARFDNQDQLSTHLIEGALLNINALGAHALSIPSGEYMVWVTDTGHTMLVPTQEKTAYGGVFGEFKEQYEVLTPALMSNWSKIERVLSEEQPPQFASGDDNGESENGDSKGEGGLFKINSTKVKRKALLRAMQSHKHTEESLATAVGVQTPMISRILHGVRVPSIGLASRITQELASDPTAIFPDIFGTQHGEKLQARDQPGNRGSGMSSAAAGSARMDTGGEWTRGGN